MGIQQSHTIYQVADFLFLLFFNCVEIHSTMLLACIGSFMGKNRIWYKEIMREKKDFHHPITVVEFYKLNNLLLSWMTIWRGSIYFSRINYGNSLHLFLVIGVVSFFGRKDILLLQQKQRQMQRYETLILDCDVSPKVNP